MLFTQFPEGFSVSTGFLSFANVFTDARLDFDLSYSMIVDVDNLHEKK